MFCPDCGTKNIDNAKFCVKCGTSLVSSVASRLRASGKKEVQKGTVLDNRYEILGIIERGGMGAVYKALDRRLNNVCAVKEMREHFEKDEYRIYAIEKFKSEALILSKLRHSNIPRVWDYFIENNRYYLVMDFIEGTNLHKLLYTRPEKRCMEDELTNWAIQICDVLSYLHHQDPPIIYRDLKPANVMITKENRVMLVDFGIARLFKPKAQGTMIGTQGYSPPEQYRGNVDPRSDIYSLSATMHHMLSGKDPQLDAPFSFVPIKELRSDISDHIAAIIDKCLKFNREERFSSVDEMKDALEGKITLTLPVEPEENMPPTEFEMPALEFPEEEVEKVPLVPPLPAAKKPAEPADDLTSELEKLLSSIEKKEKTRKPKNITRQPVIKNFEEKLEEGPPTEAEDIFSRFEGEVLQEQEEYPKTEDIIESFEEMDIDLDLEEDFELEEELAPEVEEPEIPDSTSIESPEYIEEISARALFEEIEAKEPEKIVPFVESPRENIPIQLERSRPTVPFGPIEIVIPKMKKPPASKPEIKTFDQAVDLSVAQRREEYTIPAISGKPELIPQAGIPTPAPRVTSPQYSSWYMFRGNPLHTGKNSEAKPCSGKLKWRFHTHGRIYSCPVIGLDGTIYFCSNDGCLYAMTSDGKEKWRYITDNAIYTTPLIIEGSGIYFGSEDNNFYALDFDGNKMWQIQMGNAVFSSAVIGPDNMIYVGCNDGNLYAIDINGTIKWKFTIDNFIYSSPAVSMISNCIYIGAWDKYFYAIDFSGKLKWKFKTDGIIDSSPVIDGAGHIYFGSYDNFLYALEPMGRLRWKLQTKDKIYSTPAIDKSGSIYIGSYDNYLYCISFEGTVKWRFKCNYWVKSSPCIDGEGNIYVGSDDFSLYAINPAGDLLWKFKSNGSIESSPTISESGIVIVGSNDGWLYAFQ
ncbi:MAG: PQQ-binding-like beta-propeller repeat protein [Candidatus Eremiobacteraeota bacterium]|nr:PQQ-binding-like beta-propeller repeat protein [Candidatus Eremiobacteraeota bacterium]